MRVVIAAGGTGGHIYPAVAVGKALEKDDDTSNVYYVGNPNNLEKRIADDKVFEFLGVNISGMPRKIDFSLIKWGFELFFATMKSVYYIFKYKFPTR